MKGQDSLDDRTWFISPQIGDICSEYIGKIHRLVSRAGGTNGVSQELRYISVSHEVLLRITNRSNLFFFSRTCGTIIIR